MTNSIQTQNNSQQKLFLLFPAYLAMSPAKSFLVLIALFLLHRVLEWPVIDESEVGQFHDRAALPAFEPFMGDRVVRSRVAADRAVLRPFLSVRYASVDRCRAAHAVLAVVLPDPAADFAVVSLSHSETSLSCSAIHSVLNRE